MNLEKEQQKLNSIFKENQVALAYLFGSAAKEKEGPLSDIDFGILFSDKVKEDNYLDKRLKIASAISSVLKDKKVDVLCLNEASILLRHRVVFQGTPIFVLDQDLKRKFELEVLQQYEDFKYHLETGFKIMEEQIKEGRAGKPLISPY